MATAACADRAPYPIQTGPGQHRVYVPPLAGPLALLLAELLLVTAWFDLESLAAPWRHWAWLLQRARWLAQGGVAVGTALLLFGADREPDEPRSTHAVGRSFRVLFLLLHMAAFAAFWQITTEMTRDSASAAVGQPAGTLAAWAASLVLLGVFWLAAVVPPGRWWSAARQWRGALALAAATAAAALGAGWLAQSLWRPLGRCTLGAVHQALALVSGDMVWRPDEAVVGTSTFAVEIAPACSGYEGIGLLTVFAAVYLWSFRRELRFPHALLLLPLAAAFAWLANVGRIVALIALGTWVSAPVAAGGFHSQAGWLAFNGVALGLVAVTRRTAVFDRTAGRLAARAGANATAPYLAPLIAVLLASTVGEAFTAGFDWAYPLRVVATASVLWWYRHSYARLEWSWSWPAAGIGVLAFVLWLGLVVPFASGSDAPTAAALAEAPGWLAGGWLAFRLIGAVCTVPIAEELAFRGYLVRRLQATDFESVPPARFTALSFVLSSGLFGLLHGQWLAGTAAGMLFAVALYRRGRLGDAVTAHAVTNALLAAYVLATGSWSLW